MDESATGVTVESPRIVPRRPWLAALLSLLCGGPMGQVYAGRFRRSIVLWFVGTLFLPVVGFALILLPLGRLGLALFVLLAMGFIIFLPVDAFLLAKQHRNAPLKRYQRWWVYLLIYFAFVAGNNVVAHTVRAFVAEAFMVPTRAMSPAIQHRDRILVDKLWFDTNPLQRNDIVVFYAEGPGSTLYVMRVVGLPDDEIEIRDECVFINGSAWDDKYAFFDGPLPPYFDMANHGPVIVPHDCCFLLGDNRRRARDSRFLGSIPLSDVYGKARLVYWSRDYMFPNPDDASSGVRGRLRWDRIGKRLD